MLDGEVMEVPEDDVETDTNTCCGWCRQTEEQQAEHVDLPDNLNGAAVRKGNDLNKLAEIVKYLSYVVSDLVEEETLNIEEGEVADDLETRRPSDDESVDIVN